MPADSDPTVEERAKLAEQDRRDEDRTVASSPKGASNYGYAYHEITDDGDSVICGAGTLGKEFTRMKVSDAHRRNKSPCQMCKRILEQKPNQ